MEQRCQRQLDRTKTDGSVITAQDRRGRTALQHDNWPRSRALPHRRGRRMPDWAGRYRRGPRIMVPVGYSGDWTGQAGLAGGQDLQSRYRAVRSGIGRWMAQAMQRPRRRAGWRRSCRELVSDSPSHRYPSILLTAHII